MAIIQFLTGAGRDAAGRRFAEVLAFDDAALESRHDFIQWLFPLDEPSRAVPDSPVLVAGSLATLRGSDEAKRRQRLAAERMLKFYAGTTRWRRAFDHNHLRITRIIKSLRLIAGDAEADAFKRRLFEIAATAPIDATARRFWDAA